MDISTATALLLLLITVVILRGPLGRAMKAAGELANEYNDQYDMDGDEKEE